LLQKKVAAFRYQNCGGRIVSWVLINAFATAGVWIFFDPSIARQIVDLITKYELPAEFEEREACA
jgi:hypothetical protein